MPDAAPQSPATATPAKFRKGTLAAVLGSLAAGLVFTAIPAEESGRKVAVTIADDGTAKIAPLGGHEYLEAYLDIVGVPTACDGITRDIKIGQHFTSAQCAEKLERELLSTAVAVMRCSPGLRVEGRDYQRAAATILAYNIGNAGFCGSTARKRFDAGDLRGGCDAFRAWNKVRKGGKLVVSKGLTVRRERNRLLCITGLAA